MNPNEIQNWVSVKQFQGNIYGFFNQLPIVLTKHGRPFAFILPFDTSKKDAFYNQKPVEVNGGVRIGRNAPILAIKAVEDNLPQIQQEKGIEVCEHGRQFGLCEFGCK